MLAFSPQAASLLLGAVALLIFLFYLLRARAQKVSIPSTLLLRRLVGARQRRRPSWRWLLSLLLALAIGLSLAFALTRPELAGLGGISKRVVLVLDNSPSLAARTKDGQSRWRHAQQRARQLINGVAQGSEFMVLDTMGFAGVAGFVRRDGALAALEQLTPQFFGQPRMPPLPSTVDGDVETILITDGVARLASDDNTLIESVFEPANNVAITALDARAQIDDPTRYQLFVQLLNATDLAQDVQLSVTGEAGHALQRKVHLPGGQTVSQTLDVSDFPAGTLRAQVMSEGDAFPLDDRAFAAVQLHRPRRILLVTSDNPALADALTRVPGMQVRSVKPGNFHDSAGDDLIVFDRFAPKDAPNAPAIVFGSPAASWLPRGTPAEKLVVSSWDEKNPVLQACSWRDLQIGKALPVKFAALQPKWSALVKTVQGSALLVSGKARQPWLWAGFTVSDSNLALQSWFPVLLGGAINWLAPNNEVRHVAIGNVELPEEADAVIDQDGKRVPIVRGAKRVWFGSALPGAYRVTGIDTSFEIITALTDSSVSEINRSSLAPAVAPVPAATPAATRMESWATLGLLGFALLVLEWSTFSRRITV